MLGLITGGIVKFFLTLDYFMFIFLDWIVYSFIGILYQLFMSIASVRLFGNSVIEDIANRVYIIIGVVALFLVAYALLLAIINPDNANKGETSLGKVLPNIAIAIMGMALVPTIFNIAYNVQDALLAGPIQNLILGDVGLVMNAGEDGLTCDNDSDIYAQGGRVTAQVLFQTFFYPQVDDNNVDIIDFGHATNIQSEKDETGDGKVYTLTDAYKAARCEGKYKQFMLFYLQWIQDNINYYFLISTIAGVFVCYVLLNFCIDIALRAVKLAYMQIIAPIPLLINIVPGQKKSLQTWLKKTVSCFIEVFVRIICLLFVVYLIQHLPSLSSDTMWGSSLGGQPSFIIRQLTRGLIIIGLFTFLKQAPKFFSEVLGLESKGFKLGIADKLGEMAFIGGAAKSGVNKITGTATGALGGAATGIFNKGIDTKAAMRTGAANGFAKGGNQFSAQREKTFQARYGYGANQGIFGGLSMGDKAKEKYGNDAKQSWQENAHNYATQYEQQDQIQKDGKTIDGFKKVFENMDADGAKARAAEFRRNNNSHKLAQEYAKEFCKTNNISWNDPRARAVYDEHLEAIKKNTTDENERRAITTYQNDEKLANMTYHQNLAPVYRGPKTDSSGKNTAAYDKYLREVADTQEWLAAAKLTVQGFADGTYTRKADGTHDDLYNERYKDDKGFATTGQVKTQTTDDLLKDLIAKSGSSK